MGAACVSEEKKLKQKTRSQTQIKLNDECIKKYNRGESMPSKLPRLSQPNLYNLDQRLSQPNLFSLDPCEKETKIEESNKIFKNKEMRSLQNPSLELIKNENEEEDSFFYFENNKEDIEEINQIITSQIDLLKEKKEHLTEIKQLNTLIKEEINNKEFKKEIQLVDLNLLDVDDRTRDLTKFHNNLTESIRNNAFLQNAETLKEDFNKCKKNNVILQKFAQLRKESQKGIDLLRNSVIENRKTLNQSKMFLNNLKNKLEKKKITKDDYSEMVSSIRGSAFI